MIQQMQQLHRYVVVHTRPFLLLLWQLMLLCCYVLVAFVHVEEVTLCQVLLMLLSMLLTMLFKVN